MQAVGISKQTYYRWRTKYGGMARQLQELQKENARLKRLVADCPSARKTSQLERGVI